MKKLLLVIDMQKGFINENTIFLIDKIRDLLNNDYFDKIAFTKFINYSDSYFVKKMNYKRCMDKNDCEIVIDTLDNKVLEKGKYSVFNDEFRDYIMENKISEIYLAGVDTDACVLSTAFDLFENGYDVYVLKDYCASSGGISYHEAAISILKRNIGKKQVI